jgi:hypothetical protein
MIAKQVGDMYSSASPLRAQHGAITNPDAQLILAPDAKPTTPTEWDVWNAQTTIPPTAKKPSNMSPTPVQDAHYADNLFGRTSAEEDGGVGHWKYDPHDFQMNMRVEFEFGTSEISAS